MLAHSALARLTPARASTGAIRLSRQLRSVLALPVKCTANAVALGPLTLTYFQRVCGYATVSKTTRKAPTTRSTATRKKPTSTSSRTAKKPAAKRPVGKKTATKAAAASKSKKTTATTTRAPAKRKPSKELTQTQLERMEKRKERVAEQKKKDALKELKETALQEPKNKPASPYQIMLVEAVRKGTTGTGTDQTPLGDIAKTVSQKYKSLSPSDLEHYNNLANAADQENKKAYRKWVESYSPMQIREANNARRLLKTKLDRYSKLQIQDHRAVKHPRSSYTYFFTERYATGDFKHISNTEAFKLVSDEWKALDHSQKKKYEDNAAEDKRRYVREHKRVYGFEPGCAETAVA